MELLAFGGLEGGDISKTVYCGTDVSVSGASVLRLVIRFRCFPWFECYSEQRGEDWILIPGEEV